MVDLIEDRFPLPKKLRPQASKAGRLRTKFADWCGMATLPVNESEEGSSILPVSRAVTETAFDTSVQIAREIVVKIMMLDELHRQESIGIVDVPKADI